MLNGNANDNSISRLKQILASRYGKGLELRPLTDVSEESSDKGHSVRGTDLYIPLRVKDAFLGTAVVPDAEELPTDSKHQISQMVKMVLEPSLYSAFLERREDNLRLLSEGAVDASNLKIFGQPEPPTVLPPMKPRLMQNLVHLHGHDSQRTRKAAFVLHEMTGRWAFAPWKDMCQGLMTVTDVIRLGAMTLFIEDVTTLTSDEQTLLVDYLAHPRSENDPLIVTASCASPEETSTKVAPALGDELLASALDLDRSPLSERGLREALSLLFFSSGRES